MLEHHRSQPADPARTVILGAGGFVGSACTALFRSHNLPTLPLTRGDLDLLEPAADQRLAEVLTAEDCLIVISARAPCRDAAMLRDNIAMMETVCAALTAQPVSHVIYVSSDAVYADGPVPLTEETPTAPGSLHGVMHLAREIMLRDGVAAPLALLRPTLIYGASDPHNGYGPNRFRRLAAAGEDIVLFGEGEERRDHVLVDDVAEIVLRVARHCSAGTLNVATGAVASFHDIAVTVASMFEGSIRIKSSPRTGPMPHNGYRPFDPTATRDAFPDFAYTRLSEGLRRTHREAMSLIDG